MDLKSRISFKNTNINLFFTQEFNSSFNCFFSLLIKSRSSEFNSFFKTFITLIFLFSLKTQVLNFFS